MADEPLAPDVRALWQHQVTEGGSMSATEVRRRAGELQEKARRRVAAIYMSGAGNAGIPLVLMWFLPELRLGLGYLVVTALVLVGTSVVAASSDRVPERDRRAGARVYRHLLERERDFRRDSARWFTIGPALNIIALILVYISSPLFHGSVGEIAVMALIVTTHAIVLTLVARRMGEEARRYQTELEAVGGWAGEDVVTFTRGQILFLAAMSSAEDVRQHRRRPASIAVSG